MKRLLFTIFIIPFFMLSAEANDITDTCYVSVNCDSIIICDNKIPFFILSAKAHKLTDTSNVYINFDSIKICDTKASFLMLSTKAHNITDTSYVYVNFDSIIICDNKVRNNWFISLSGGVAGLYGEQSTYVNFFDRITPAFGLSFGKWISSTVAFRVNITGSKLQGYTTWEDETNLGPGSWYFGKNHPYKDFNITNNYIPAFLNAEFGEEIKKRYFGSKLNTNGYTGYIYRIPYLAETIDAMVDMNNLFSPCNKNRLLEIYLYAGVGVSQTFGDHSRDQTNVNSIIGRIGGTLNLRLTDRIGINLDGNWLIVPEFFDWRVGDGNTMDLVGNCTIGLTYNFKNQKKSCYSRYNKSL